MWLRRFVVAWTLLAVVGWLVTVSGFDPEPDCDQSREFICFERNEVWLWSGVIVAVPWFAGLFVAALVAGLVWWHRKLSDAP